MLIPIATVVMAEAWPAGIALAVAAPLVLLLFYALRQVVGTTLRAPCVWALVSTTCVAWIATISNSEPGIGLSALRFAAAASTLCPLMAVLGAKRPQNHGWQWVVLTLWIVLVWPAAQALLSPAGPRIELFVAWKLFLVGLVVVGLLNYLPTKNGFAACVFAIGQLVLLDDYLWRWSTIDPQWVPTVGLSCFLVAAAMVRIRHHKKEKKIDLASKLSLADFDQRWQSFRDAYGALWALRILARVNQTAEVSDWPVRLSWSGFTLLETDKILQPSEEQLDQLKQTMTTLLRRFV